MTDLAINAFDVAVYLCLVVAVVAGYRSGLLRSLATMFGYVVAAPLVVAAIPYLAPFFNGRLKLTPAQMPLVYFVGFIVIGFVLGALFRGAVTEMSGQRISAPDRAAGAFLGAIRVALLAVLMVLVFERLIPAGREPAFLTGSTLRPILSQAGQEGLRHLPPDIADYIDRIKRERGL